MRSAPLLLLALSLAACPAPAPGTSDTTDTTDSTATTDSGDSTRGPTTGPEVLQRCAPTCQVDVDCRFGGVDIGFDCVAGECRPPPCADDLECQRMFSNWQDPCAGPDDCSFGRVCVDIGGGDGRCAAQPGPGITCADIGLVELTRPTLPGGRTLVVCGNADATCSATVCKDPCDSDADCSPEFGAPHCDPGTGDCVCATDLECQTVGVPGFAACIAGRCGCQLDADCVGGINVDTCVDGACGCSGTDTCTDPFFDHAVLVCQPD